MMVVLGVHAHVCICMLACVFVGQWLMSGVWVQVWGGCMGLPCYIYMLSPGYQVLGMA